MRISHRYKFIFFANPKTGSSSVRTFLAPHSDVFSVKNYHYVNEDNPFYPHMTPAEARPFFEQFGWQFNAYYKFVFVRNPWARLVSAYEHIKRSTDEVPLFRKWLFQIKPFENGGGGSDEERWRKYSTYSIEHFIKDDKGNILVDKVIKLEDIDKDFISFLKALGLPIHDQAKIMNKNLYHSSYEYQNYYDQDTTDYVANLYRYDIVHFGYSF